MNSTKSILVTGATGLIGRSLIKLLQQDQYFNEIIILSRRRVPEWTKDKRIQQHIVDLSNPSGYRNIVKADTVVSALGTTIKKAGSQDKFREVDYQMPLNLAQAASANNCSSFILVSAVGSSPDSRVFYNKVKGEVERDLVKIKFKSIHILHPSLLLGERNEKRIGEKIGQIFMPLMSFLIPEKYRPVQADVIAKRIIQLAKSDKQGIYHYEGKDLYPQK
jgi:uncharacterized protein YbjT (DUF2867 family)